MHILLVLVTSFCLTRATLLCPLKIPYLTFALNPALGVIVGSGGKHRRGAHDLGWNWIILVSKKLAIQINEHDL